MTDVLVHAVRRGFYLDSVALMRLSRSIAQMEGVVEAALMMATPANLRIMADAGLLDGQEPTLSGGDLVIAIAATDGRAADGAMQEAGRLLDTPRRAKGANDAWRPHTLESALAALPGANLALISVAGDYAAAEARNALRLGLHVMIFSDNVSIEDEAALKIQARERGLLVMGPDCGTAIINGTPLAFANAVPRGSIGIIGASGTGIQEVSCLIDRGGGGVSQAIGVGGRDLSPAVGAVTTLMAIDALDHDPGSTHVVIISKPPAPEVAARVIQRIADSPKTFTVCFLGSSAPQLPVNATFAETLKAAAESACAGYRFDPVPAPTVALPELSTGRKYIRGLYSGGTLCGEAQVILRRAGEPVASNVPISGVSQTDAPIRGHVIFDLGEDRYTRGRPHPMIDPAVRDDAVVDALRDHSVGAVLLDVVLGYGAHRNPARHVHDLLMAQRTADMPVVVASVTGTEDDPQRRSAQVDILESAGVLVAGSNADAAALALAAVR